MVCRNSECEGTNDPPLKTRHPEKVAPAPVSATLFRDFFSPSPPLAGIAYQRPSAFSEGGVVDSLVTAARGWTARPKGNSALPPTVRMAGLAKPCAIPG